MDADKRKATEAAAVPEDLPKYPRSAFGLDERPGENYTSYETALKHISGLQERIARLEQENATLKARAEKAEAKAERLSAKVSDPEWRKLSTTALLEGCIESDEFIYRDDADELIAARAGGRERATETILCNVPEVVRGRQL